MHTAHITTSQRAIAYLLLVCQLLTSCGLNETILPSNQEQERIIQQEKVNPQDVVDLSTKLAEQPSEIPSSVEEEERTAPVQSIASPTSHTSSQAVTSTPFTFQAKGGQEVTVAENGLQATVQENLNHPFKEPRLLYPFGRHRK